MTPSIANAPSVSESEVLPQHSDVEAPQNANDATDIEHAPVHDDPRQWSNARKVRVNHSALTANMTITK